MKKTILAVFPFFALMFVVCLMLEVPSTYAITPSSTLVETYPSVEEFHSTSDEGNYVRLEIYGWQLDPTENTDPSYDYYIFHIWATADAASDWSPTSGGLDDLVDPTMKVNVSLRWEGTFMTEYVEPRGYVSEGSAGTISLGLTIPIGPVSVGVSWSQQVPQWECQTTAITDEAIEWEAADNSGSGHYDRAYSWGFSVGAMLPKGEECGLRVVMIGSFYQPGTFPIEAERYGLDFSTSFSGHAGVTVDPNGGRIYVDDEPLTSTEIFLWVYESTHELDPDSGYSPSGNTRLLFVGWQDGFTSDPRAIRVERDETYTAEWKKQYYLSVETNPQNITPRPILSPEGPWFDEETYVNCVAQDCENYAFIHWIVDGEEKEKGQHSIFIYMDSPHSAIAIYDQRPVAKLSVDKNVVDMNETVTFDASNSTDDCRVEAYFFDFGDGTNSGWTTLSMVTHEYAEEGEYNVTLIVMDDFGVTSLDGNLVYVEITVVPEFPSLIILPLFIIATLLAAIVHRRKRTH